MLDLIMGFGLRRGRSIRLLVLRDYLGGWLFGVHCREIGLHTIIDIFIVILMSMALKVWT